MVWKITVTGWLWSLHYIPHLRSPTHDQRTAPNQWSGHQGCPCRVRNGPHPGSTNEEKGSGAEELSFQFPWTNLTPGAFLARCFSPLSTPGGSPAPPTHATAAPGDPSGSPGMRGVTASMQEGSLWTSARCQADRKFQKDHDWPWI